MQKRYEVTVSLMNMWKGESHFEVYYNGQKVPIYTPHRDSIPAG